MKKFLIAALGGLMVLGVFFPWKLSVNSNVRYFHEQFLGLRIHSFDSLLGFHSFPIIVGIFLIILSFLLAKGKIIKYLCLGATGISILLLAYSGGEFMFQESESYLGLGYWLTLVVTILGFIVFIKFGKSAAE